jgi:hypothetical protein
MKRGPFLCDVIPAQAGIQCVVMNESRWVPLAARTGTCFAGTTRVRAEPDHA